MDQVDSKNLIVGLDVASTTVKSVVVDTSTDQIIWSDYQRHDTKQPEKCLEFLKRMEAEAGIKAGETRIFVTGSGGGPAAFGIEVLDGKRNRIHFLHKLRANVLAARDTPRTSSRTY